MSDIFALTKQQHADFLKMRETWKREQRQRPQHLTEARLSSDENFIAWIDTEAIPAATGTPAVL